MTATTALLYALTAISTAWVTATLLRWHHRIPILDIPNERSSHSQPKPRSGGIAIFSGIAVGTGVWIWFQNARLAPEIGWALLGGAAFFGLGLLDDIYHLPEWLRFLVEVTISGIIATFGPRLVNPGLPGLADWRWPPALSILVTTFWYTGFLNLFNFMDGTDGIAAGEAALAGAWIWLITGSVLPAIVSAAALGFLAFNREPSRVFMGDSGSYLLGFLLAVTSVIGSHGSAPFIVFILLLATFIVDTSVTLARRVSAGETWYKAHRSHYYQRLSILGWSHAKIARLNLGLTACLGLTSFVYLRVGTYRQVWLLIAWMAVFGAGILAIHSMERRTVGRLLAAPLRSEWVNSLAVSMIMILWGLHLAFPMPLLQNLRCVFFGYSVPIYYFFVVLTVIVAGAAAVASRRNWTRWERIWWVLPLIALPSIVHSGDRLWSCRQWLSWILRGVVPGGVLFLGGASQRAKTLLFAWIYPLIIAASLFGLAEVYFGHDPIWNRIDIAIPQTTQAENPFYRPANIISLSSWPRGTQGNRIPYAATIVGFLPLAIWQARYRSKSTMALNRAGAWILPPLLLLAQVRSVWAGALAALLLMPLLGFWRYRLRDIKTVLGAMVVVLFLLFWPRTHNALWHRLRTLSVADESIQQRLAVLETASVLKDHWLLGVGFGQFPTACRPYYHSALYWWGTPDNQYLRWAIENGPISLALLMAFLVGLVRAGWAKIRRIKNRQQADFFKALLIGWISVAVTFAFFDGFYWGACNMTFWCLLGLFAACLDTPAESRTSAPALADSHVV